MATASDHELLAAIVEAAAIEYEQEQQKAEKVGAPKKVARQITCSLADDGLYNLGNLRPEAIIDHWDQFVTPLFWYWGEKDRSQLWPEDLECDLYDGFLRTRSLKDVTEEQFRAPPHEIVRCLVFSLKNLVPRKPRGFFKIIKEAHIDTKANMKRQFMVWEPQGKIKIYSRKSLTVQTCIFLGDVIFHQVALRPKTKELFAWTTCKETFAKRLVRVGLKRSLFTRKMQMQTRKQYDFASSEAGIVGCRVDMDERSLCAVANAATSGASVIWLENLTTGKLEWKRVCNESFTSVVLYPYHVLMLKKQTMTNFPFAGAMGGDDACARIMLVDRKDGSLIFTGKNMRAVASGLRHWVVLKPRAEAVTLLDLRYAYRDAAHKGFSVITSAEAREKNADQVRASRLSKSGRYLLNVTKPDPYSDTLALKVYDLDCLSESDCAGLTFERFQPSRPTCTILPDGTAVLEADKEELLYFIGGQTLDMFAQFCQK